MNFSLQQAPAPTRPPVSTQDLPPLERPRRRAGKGKGRRVLLFTVLLGLGVCGVLLAAGAGQMSGSTLGLKKFFGPGRSSVLTHRVMKGDLAITVKEKGALESANNLEAKSEVEGQTTIISILPEGTRVVEKQLVCELDSASLKDQLANQQIATERAKADYENAKKTYEVAEINVEEYLKGIYPQDVKTVDGEIKLAQSDLARARDRLEWSNKMYELGYISQSQNLGDQYELQRAEFSYQQALQKKEVMEKYTKEKQLKSLAGDVEKAKADMLAKDQTFKLEKEKEEKLRRMIEKCKIYAPGNGIVVYHQEQNRFGASDGPSIQEGATVRERQIIFKLPDIDNMQVNTKVHESMVDKVKPGLSCKIRVDAFPNQLLDGEVVEVKPLPDPTSFFSSDIKVYTTLVKIKNAHDGLRPGMSAETEILIAKLKDVMSIPVQAIIEYGGKPHVWVQTENNGWENRVIKVGLSNTKYVEVTDGLKVDDVVALDPRSVMTEAEKQIAFASGSDKKEGDDAEGWSDADAAKAKEAASKASAKGKNAAGGRGGAGGAGMEQMKAIFSKMRNLSEEDRTKLRDPSLSDEDRKALMKKAGITDAEIEQMDQMRRQFGGGMGGGGGGFGGPGGGGMGGGGGFGGPGGGGGGPRP